jgi:hypothetical protein
MRLKLKMTIAIGILSTGIYATDLFACNEWNFGSSFTIQQNNGAVVTLSRIQRGRLRDSQTFSADASYSGGKGNVKGTLDWDGRFSFDIFWDNGSVGRYTAHVNQGGAVLDGTTQDQVHPDKWSHWTMKNRIVCTKP